MDNAEKTAYQEKMEGKLTQLKADIQRLEADMREKKADITLATREQLQQLRWQANNVNDRVHALKTTSGAAWNEARSGVASAWSDLQSAFQKASAEFKRT